MSAFRGKADIMAKQPRGVFQQGASMPGDIIHDPNTGHQVACVDTSGKVRDANTNEVVALVIEGKLYSTCGGFLGHLENSDKAQSWTAPERFMKLLKTRK
jgi:hypothetical protein